MPSSFFFMRYQLTEVIHILIWKKLLEKRRHTVSIHYVCQGEMLCLFSTSVDLISHSILLFPLLIFICSSKNTFSCAPSLLPPSPRVPKGAFSRSIFNSQQHGRQEGGVRSAPAAHHSRWPVHPRQRHTVKSRLQILSLSKTEKKVCSLPVQYLSFYGKGGRIDGHTHTKKKERPVTRGSYKENKRRQSRELSLV